jgi:nucleoside-diphosphate-sugar epimerase
VRIAITGGSGFVGGHLTVQLRASGHSVTRLSRIAVPSQTDLTWSLEDELPSAQLEGFDVLIHAAWDFTKPEVNVPGSIRLFQAAKAASIPRVVFISSLSAFEGCRSQYGAMKLAVEEAGAALDACTIRLGFVCDHTDCGLSGGLKKLATLPVVPLPGGGRQNLFTIQAEDLAPAFLRILEHSDREPVNLAHPEPVSLADMLRAFARQHEKNPVFLPVPWRLLWLPLRVAEAAGLNLRFRSDSLVSLMNQDPAPDFRRLEQWGVVLGRFQP